MNIAKTASSGIFKIVEKIIRSHPLVYFISRCLIRFTNIFEDDANGVKLLNFKKKINIIDVGASDGIATKFFYKNLSVNKIICYEPNKPYVDILKKLNFNNVIVRPYGISQKESKHKVFLPRYKFLKRNFDLVTYTFYDKKDLIKQIKIDFKFIKNITIIKKIILLKRVKKMSYRISLIKIDVNGHEYSVVRGLQTIIKRDKPAMIIETDKNIKKIESYLKKFSYEKYLYDAVNKNFKKINKNYPLNTYFLQKNHLG